MSDEQQPPTSNPINSDSPEEITTKDNFGEHLPYKYRVRVQKLISTNTTTNPDDAPTSVIFVEEQLPDNQSLSSYGWILSWKDVPKALAAFGGREVAIPAQDYNDSVYETTMESSDEPYSDILENMDVAQKNFMRQHYKFHESTE